MVAVKAADVDAFVARPDPARRVVLVFGPDAGLAGERVRALLAASVDDINDPFALARLDGEELAAEPSRLIEEALTMPLFGGRRAVWVKAGSRNIAPAVEALLGDPLFAASPTCRVVIEAGELRRNAPLRVVCERAKNAAALPCYADTERDRARLIDEEMRAAGLSLAADARAALIPLLGGDRAASRSEIQKLALYARGRSQIGVEDVAAVVSSSAKPAPPATARVRSCSTRSGSSPSCTSGAWQSSRAARSRLMRFSRRCRSGADRSSKRRSRPGARRGSPMPWRIWPTRCCSRGAIRRWPTPSPSGRCSRSRPADGVAQLDRDLRRR